jgi:FKBP-type peptidyl-prolyl cis-trans isomerase
VDVDVLASSIKDVLKGNKSQLSPEDMRAAMMAAQQDMQAKMAKEGEANMKKGTDFLAANKSKEGVTTTPSGLQYKVVQPGKGATPTDKDTVVCHYKGTLIDGTEFDSSYKRGEPAEFPVSGVIAGWTESLKTMKEGEKRQLFIPSELAYGPQGRPGIPPNSVLLFDIELLTVKKAGKGSK